MVDARRYATNAVLRDGGSVHVRAIRPDDGPAILEHFHRMSDRSVYLRFFSSRRRFSDEDLRRFTDLDFVDRVGLAATLREGGKEHIIGVAHYIVTPTPPGETKRAEVAFSVADAHQGRGIATLLLEELARIAQANGIGEFEADVLGENNRMLEVFGASGFGIKRSLDQGVFHLTFPTEVTEEAERASQLRDRTAAAQSLRPILAPRSIAIVGASSRRGTIGHALVTNVQRAGFRGPVYPVHPTAESIAGLAAHRSVSAIGAPVDLAIVAVPAAAVEAVVEDCAAAGVRGLVVISSGFAEVSPEGRRRQDALRDRIRTSGMRLVGPNCLGVMNTDPNVRLNATFAPTFAPPGNVGMLSQSGAIALVVLDYAKTRGSGLSTFVSVGNKADVSSNDLLAYWAEDPATNVIALYLESFGNPRKFARRAPEIARQKPIVAMKSGRSAAGARAASSHSASLASLDVAVDALFAQAGVIRANTLEELFDVTELLSSQPPPKGARVGVVTNAGGPGILLADTCEGRGLSLPELAAATTARLKTFLPAQAGLANPVDMIASADAEQYALTIEAVGRDPSIDALIVVHVPTMVSDSMAIGAGIARGVGTLPAEKPAQVVFLSSAGAPASLHAGPRGRLPSYAFPENAALALAAAAHYGKWRERPQGEIFRLDRFAESAVRAVVERVLADADGPRWLAPADVACVLRAAGIELAASESTTPESAVALAERLGFPLVAKLVSRDVLHKSDVGGVVLGLRTPQDVARATDRLVERAKAIGARVDGILLQREVTGGIETLVGVTSDPTFGPLVVCGLGGVLVELLRDVAFRLTPVSDFEAREMIASLRTGRLLDGYRGSPPGDRAALVEIIRRVSALVEIVPELRELDLNPVSVLEPGKGAVALDARIRIAPG